MAHEFRELDFAMIFKVQAISAIHAEKHCRKSTTSVTTEHSGYHAYFLVPELELGNKEGAPPIPGYYQENQINLAKLGCFEINCFLEHELFSKNRKS